MKILKEMKKLNFGFLLILSMFLCSCVSNFDSEVGDRSEKIRTYNFPQNRVTDHRIDFTSHNLEAFLDGDMEDIFKTLLEENQSRMLLNLEDETTNN